MANLNIRPVTMDSETKTLMSIFKTVVDKEETANILANRTVAEGLKQNSVVLKHFYDENEPAHITSTCISLGLINYMLEDFYTIKEVLGFNYVLRLLETRRTLPVN
ncbi:hypothetical protein LL037_18600 [Clostridium estertheticum]|uniref:hypothetical protein n=1 Tax=Clostridium estertheticum TaxID=238834 RepID=UPI001C0D783B|nr:hypothetical protein [Clostridium estertheticum]MBU3200292.1 hypothetical protein [Clostridium estertheticum]WAG64463.1 hypothetical protein LL037_18600 [Clostridium estertheticum]